MQSSCWVNEELRAHEKFLFAFLADLTCRICSLVALYMLCVIFNTRTETLAALQAASTSLQALGRYSTP